MITMMLLSVIYYTSDVQYTLLEVAKQKNLSTSKVCFFQLLLDEYKLPSSKEIHEGGGRSHQMLAHLSNIHLPVELPRA